MRFREWSPKGRAIYNPFERGNPTEIVDKIMAAQRWTEPHYELIQRLFGMVLPTMKAAGRWPPTMPGIVDHMDPERLDALAAEVGGEIGARVAKYVDGLTARNREALDGGRNRLAVLAEGELGPRLDPDRGDGPLLSFERSLREREVLYFHIDSDRYPAASKLLAAALVTDLVTLTADIQMLVDRWQAKGQAASTIRNSIKPLQAIYRRARSRDEPDRVSRRPFLLVSNLRDIAQLDPLGNV
jgi:hypothetical protein